MSSPQLACSTCRLSRRPDRVSPITVESATPRTDASPDRTLPSGDARRQPVLARQEKPGLYDQQARRPVAASLPFMRGQSCVSQARTKTLSRSRSYIAGCCALPPSAVSRRARGRAG